MAKFRQMARDKGYNKLLKATRKFTSWRGAIDVEDKTYASGVTTRQVVDWHLKGTARMPKRDFLTYWWVNGGEKQLRKDQRRAARILVDRANDRQTRRELEAAGHRAVQGVRDAFSKMSRLAQSTIQRKGHARVLIETGKLHDSIFFKPLR